MRKKKAGGGICPLEDCATVFIHAPMFCTPFVDKIVRKNFDSMEEP